MKKTQKELEFIKYIRNRCKEHGVKCDLRNTKFLRSEGIDCSGWFDSEVPELVVSMNRPDWIEILAHEYSHLTQWVEQIPLWKESEVSSSILWDWLAGEDCDDIDHHINVVRDLELDNEKRSVNIIQKFGLNVDIDRYIRKANSYVMFYNYIKTSRRWTKADNSPYKNERLLEAIPTKFNMRYKSLPKRLEKIFIEEGF